MAPVFTAPVGDSGAPKLPFVDQADSSFARFRRELQMRLQNYDTWIRATHLYSPVGWRAFFEHRGDRWIMTIFVAGD